MQELTMQIRRAVQCTQQLADDSDLFTIQAQVYAEKPKKDIYDFIGNFINRAGVSISLPSLPHPRN